jgi:N-acetylmuramoyl-L-alanine amidase
MVRGNTSSWAARGVVKGFLLAAMTGSLLAGCSAGRVHANGSLVAAPAGALSVYQLAERLGMQVVDVSIMMATLRNSHNTVVIYAEPGSQAYVNGRAMAAPKGGVMAVDDILFVPQDYEPAIRSALRLPSAPQAPPSLPPPSREPPPTRQAIGRLGTVVIDAGHGGQDPGAISVYGVQEKAIVLDVAQTVAERLIQSGVDVRLTRDGDEFIPLEGRTDIANRCRAVLLVSIHADAAPRNRAASGFTVYTNRTPSRGSIAAADAVIGGLSSAGAVYRGRHEANYRVLVGASCPAILVELGFLSNRREAASLGNQGYRDRLADAIAAGILDYLRSR